MPDTHCSICHTRKAPAELLHIEGQDADDTRRICEACRRQHQWLVCGRCDAIIPSELHELAYGAGGALICAACKAIPTREAVCHAH